MPSKKPASKQSKPAPQQPPAAVGIHVGVPKHVTTYNIQTLNIERVIAK